MEQRDAEQANAHGVPEGTPEERDAAAFYAPMFLLYSVYDGAEDKEAVLALADELLEQARTHLNRSKEMGEQHG